MASTFSKSVQQWVKVNEYATKRVVGVTIGNRQSVIRKCRAGMPVRFEREPKNKADPNAIAVYAEGNQIGYLPADVAKWAASNLDSGRVQYQGQRAHWVAMARWAASAMLIYFVIESSVSSG